MKNYSLLLIIIVGAISLTEVSSLAASNVKSKKSVARPQAVTQSSPSLDAQLQAALNLSKAGDYIAASKKLFSMTRNPQYSGQRMRIKYILGLMFYEMKMYQVAAFQFVDVVRSGDSRYIKQALQKLSIAADILNDDTLINYAIGKVSVEDFPKENHDMLRYRIGEYEMHKDHWDLAAVSLSKVPSNSAYFPKAKYLEGLAHVKRGDLNAALKSYSVLVESRSRFGVTDHSRIAGILGMGRVYYQAHRWDLAMDMFRDIPRDTEEWHESLFELSWAHMRGAQFRSVLSILHSLHSPYYEDYFLPESILLRGIVYLYICKYDEMKKTLNLFEKIYQPVLTSLDSFTAQNTDNMAYFNEIEKVIKNFDTLKANQSARSNYKIPFIVARNIIREGDFKRLDTYISKLRSEQAIISEMPTDWHRSAVGVYADQLVRNRITSTSKVAGSVVRAHMLTMKHDLSGMFEQYNFAKYEMLNGEKEQLKKHMAGKGLATSQIDESKNRDFYIQNGYQYWPFRGEYWLDEIGDYQYLGTQGCE
jgi:tetratricopeptide (TPR) repeat protein